jgi:hypothetical protein
MRSQNKFGECLLHFNSESFSFRLFSKKLKIKNYTKL